MPDITVHIPGEVAERLAVLTNPALLTNTATTADAARDAVAVLIDHAEQGVYRGGSWERSWLMQAFGDEWLSRLVPDTRPGMLSGGGQVIFDRPKDGTDERG